MSFRKKSEWHFFDRKKKEFFTFETIKKKNSRYLLRT
jgi:hypothetical protein